MWISRVRWPVAVLMMLHVNGARCDEIELRNGSRIQGLVVRQTVDTITIGTKALSTRDVLAITIEGRRRQLAGAGPKDHSKKHWDSESFTGLSSEAYQRKFNELVLKGYRPVAIRGFSMDGEARHDLTMAKAPKGRWFARHDCSHSKFIGENERGQGKGFSLVVHSQFRVGGKATHAGVWEVPPVRFHGAGEVPETGTTARAFSAIDEIARSFVREHDVPGLAIAIAKEGRLVYARGFGCADVEKKEPVRPDSLFRIASVSKPITAVAVMQLIERGRLSLDTRMLDVLRPGAAHGQEADRRLQEITVRHLLQHSAGWDRRLSFDPMFRSVQIAKALGVPAPAEPDHIVRFMLGQSLDFSPGERSAYSNFGYCVLGRIIERLAGQRYEDYVRRNVLAPLGVKRMQVGKSRLAERADGEVRYYTRYPGTGPSVFEADLGASVPVQYGAWHVEAMDSHGGWIGTATDLVRFASALDDSAKTRVLSRESAGEMFAPPPAPIGRSADGKLKSAYYACGWRVRPIRGGKANTWHAGALAGTSTLLVRRHDGFCWAVLCNTDAAINGEPPSHLIDAPMHRAVNSVRDWRQGGHLGR